MGSAPSACLFLEPMVVRRPQSALQPAPHPKRLGCIGASEVVKSLIPFFTASRLRWWAMVVPARVGGAGGWEGSKDNQRN